MKSPKIVLKTRFPILVRNKNKQINKQRTYLLINKTNSCSSIMSLCVFWLCYMGLGFFTVVGR